MSRPPFWLAALALSCATSKSAESQLQLSGKEETQTTAVEHREFQSTEHDGPWRVTRYYFGGKEGGGAPVTAPSLPTALTSQPGTVGSVSEPAAPSSYLASQPTIVEVEDHFGRDITRQASSDGLRGAETRVDVKADAEAHSSSKTRWGPPWWAYALIAVVLAALAAAAWKCKPPFLSFLWKLL